MTATSDGSNHRFDGESAKDPASQGGVADRIRARLTAAFTPDALEVVDESEMHRGHMGWREGGETHFRVTIVASAFDGMSRVARHRAVNQCLDEELAGPVHALALAIHSPSETGADMRLDGAGGDG